MWEIHRILVPVDFSEHSEHALEEAIELAKRFGAELHLLHCCEIFPDRAGNLLYNSATALPENYESEIRRAATANLTRWREKATAQGVRAEQHLVADRPSHGIVAMAERLAADLIVIGTYGLTGLKHVLLGSVAERTVRHAPCPVLTVKRR